MLSLMLFIRLDWSTKPTKYTYARSITITIRASTISKLSLKTRNIISLQATISNTDWNSITRKLELRFQIQMSRADLVLRSITKT